MIKLSPFQWSAMNFFGYYCAYGVLLPFLPMWLKSVGYGTETIGLLIALGYLFRFTGGMLFASRIKQLNQLIPMSRWLAWLSLVAVIFIGWAGGHFWALLVAVGIFHILNGGGTPMSDTIASTWQQQQGMDYGKARLYGSLAFVVGSLVTGYIVGQTDASMILWILGAMLFLFASGQMLPPICEFEQTERKQDSDLSYWQVFSHPNTARMLIAASLVQAGHAAYYAYGTIYWQSTGISTEMTSLLWSIAVAAEIGLFFVAKRAFSTQPIARLMIISAIGAMIRWIIVANTQSLPLIMLSQLLHAVSFALNHFAIIRYISSQPSAQIPKLQGLYFGLASCAVMALFTFLAGMAYNIAPIYSFWLMVCLIAPAIVIVPRRFITS